MTRGWPRFRLGHAASACGWFGRRKRRMARSPLRSGVELRVNDSCYQGPLRCHWTPNACQGATRWRFWAAAMRRSRCSALGYVAGERERVPIEVVGVADDEGLITEEWHSTGFR